MTDRKPKLPNFKSDYAERNVRWSQHQPMKQSSDAARSHFRRYSD